MTTQFIINHLWQSSCFVPLAGLLAFVLRKNSPKTRYWVWLSASLKFLVPFALLVSLGSVVPPPARHTVSVPAPIFPSILVDIAEPFSPTSYATIPAHAPLRRTPAAAGVVWALGFFAITLARCRSWFRIRATLRASTSVELPIPVPVFISPRVEEPGIVGFLRPVLVLPAQLLEHLNPRQLHAVLTHELSHVRRRDNFFAAVHMVVEAIFWFHPLVWWIGSRMVEERELACDEEVLRTGCEPTDYVEAILKVCRFYTGSPLACVSGVTGADVKKRLHAILAGSIARELNFGRKVTLAAIGLAVLAAPIVIGVLNAPQAQAQSRNAAVVPAAAVGESNLTFEVASIKPHVDGALGSTGRTGYEEDASQIRIDNLSLRALVAIAYGLNGREQLSAPGWLNSATFDIVAKPPAGYKHEQLQYLVRNLLVDRFKLTVHHETKLISVFALVVAKGGHKLHEAAGPRTYLTGRPGLIEGKQRSIGDLADVLTSVLGRPVVNQTGLSATYDLKLEWTPDAAPQTEGGADAGAPAEPGLSLFTALQEQLGLRLESQKVPADVVIVDHVERVPTEN